MIYISYDLRQKRDKKKVGKHMKIRKRHVKSLLVKSMSITFAFALVLTSIFNIGKSTSIFALNEGANALGIITETKYSDDKKNASLQLDFTNVDQQKVTIQDITGPNGEAMSMEQPSVSVYDNGSYDVTIKYVENIEEPVEEPASEEAKTKEAPQPIEEKAVSTTQEVKELKVNFTVDGIMKDKGKKENIVNGTNLNSTSKNPSSRLVPNPDSDIDLAGQFNVSAKATTNGVITDISEIILASINKNYIMTTKKGLGDYEAVSLTSKNTIDFSRSFVMSGVSNQAAAGWGDGFLFAFHNKPDYMYAGGYSSNLGFYNHQKNNGFQDDAFIVEADMWNNYDDSAPIFADYPGVGFENAHLNILEMKKSDPRAPVRLAENRSISMEQIAGEHSFSIVWDAPTKTISLSISGESVSYTGFDAIQKFGTSKLYYTIGSASGVMYQGGFDSEFVYDGFKYTDFEAISEATYTVTDSSNNKVSVPSTAVDNLMDYAKPGDTVHVTHKLTNSHTNAIEDISESIKIFNSALGNEELRPIIGSLKKYSDLDSTRHDITEDIFNDEYTTIAFPKSGSGSAYIEYDIKLPNQITKNSDIMTTIGVGAAGMSQFKFDSNAKVAGNPTLNNLMDMDVAITASPSDMSDAEIKAGIVGHTYDSTTDIDLSIAQANLELTYVIKDMSNKVVSSIPKDKFGGYIVEYKLMDTREGSKLTSSGQRKIWIADNHVSENGIDIISKNFSVNEVELITHESDLESFVKKEAAVKAYWSADGSEIKSITTNLQGFKHDSVASDTPYPVKFTAQKNSQTATIETKITVTPNIIGYIEIPKVVVLSDNGGIDEDHAGAKIDIGIKKGVTTSHTFDVSADTNFEIRNTLGNSYVVGLYDGNKQLFATSNGKATIGSFDNTNRTKVVWYNIERDLSRNTSEYSGTMMFYISAK